jgi:hypothetical protein
LTNRAFRTPLARLVGWLVRRPRRLTCHSSISAAIGAQAAELRFGSLWRRQTPFLAILATSVGFPASPASDCPSSFCSAIGAKSCQLSARLVQSEHFIAPLLTWRRVTPCLFRLLLGVLVFPGFAAAPAAYSAASYVAAVTERPSLVTLGGFGGFGPGFAISDLSSSFSGAPAFSVIFGSFGSLVVSGLAHEQLITPLLTWRRWPTSPGIADRRSPGGRHRREGG